MARRLVLVLCGILLGGAILEAAVRLLRLGAYAKPKLLAADGSIVADLSQIAIVFGAPRDASSTSLTQMSAGTLVYGWYDRPRWRYFDGQGRVEYRINSLGFRDRDFPLAKREDELRVLAIGDSFTFGSGVQLDDCWVQAVERGLAAGRQGPVEVVNGGYCRGYKPDMYAEWLANQGMWLEPDAVIVGLCLNDVSDGIPMALELAAPIEPLLGGHVRVVTLLQQALATWSAAPEGEPTLKIKLGRLLAQRPTEWPECQAGLLAIQRTLAATSTRMIVVVFPMLTQLRSGYPFREVHELVDRFCADHEIECLDLLDRFLGHDERDLWVHPTDQHPNDVGHRMIAEGILEHLARHPIAPGKAKR